VTSPVIRLDVAAPFGEIVLNKPEKRNALSLDMWAAIPDLVHRCVADPDVKIVLIHGGDAGAFAAGADISEFKTIYATAESARASGRTIAAALDALETCPKPTIAAIEGPCVGGGVSIAMATDLRVGGGGARFGVTPAKLGLVYPASDTRRLLAVIGPARTKDLLFTGRLLDAEEALAIGLVDRRAEPGEALKMARTLGAEIVAVSQWSTRATKKMITGLESGWRDDAAEAEALFVQGFSNEDFQEGYRAFLAKRAARFTFK
jgi:enoyl-CoA hydratase/carnithine racemase